MQRFLKQTNHTDCAAVALINALKLKGRKATSRLLPKLRQEFAIDKWGTGQEEFEQVLAKRLPAKKFASASIFKALNQGPIILGYWNKPTLLCPVSGHFVVVEKKLNRYVVYNYQQRNKEYKTVTIFSRTRLKQLLKKYKIQGQSLRAEVYLF